MSDFENLVSVVSLRWKGGHFLTPGTRVYVGRPTKYSEGSVLGNPFRTTGHTVEEHQKVVNQYAEWLRTFWSLNETVAAEINRLVDIVCSGEHLVLECWCAPLPCHADVIRAVIIDRAKARKATP